MLLEVQCEVSTVSDDLGCHVICWCWSTVFSEIHSQRSHLLGNFRALHASFCWQALWRCWFHFLAELGPCPHCQRYQKLVQWPWCYCACLASKLAWPVPQGCAQGGGPAAIATAPLPSSAVVPLSPSPPPPQLKFCYRSDKDPLILPCRSMFSCPLKSAASLTMCAPKCRWQFFPKVVALTDRCITNYITVSRWFAELVIW